MGFDRVRWMKFELTAPASKIAPLVFLVKNLLTFLVSGGNVMIAHNLYHDSFPLIACLAVAL